MKTLTASRIAFKRESRIIVAREYNLRVMDEESAANGLSLPQYTKARVAYLVQKSREPTESDLPFTDGPLDENVSWLCFDDCPTQELT